MTDMLQKAAKIADEVLLPAASEVDRYGRIPGSHFDRLAEDGFYGLVAPPEFGGLGVEFPDFLELVEILASACLTTTFTWLQHHGVVMGLAMTPNSALRAQYLGRAASGELRGGSAFSGAIPVPPHVRATRSGEGWTINGQVPFVSGWGLVDVLHVSALDEQCGDVVSGLIEAKPGDGIAAVHPLSLVAAQASNTVRLEFRDLHLPDEMVTTRANRDEYIAGLARGSRVDGSLALGLLRRAVALLESAGQLAIAEAVRARAAQVRTKFDAAMAFPADLPVTRAACSELAQQACTAYLVAVGGAGLVSTHDAQRLTRESLFTLVVAGRPDVRTALLGLLERRARCGDHAVAGGFA
ncbi:acyl-CoA dehydrogenase family protein [Kutzneria sp. CA-103260]|uniref:acyl-CoA dehydrogenase family protein n=1 Tax=Kutzneria sp. CA-103260 TaxID=2802641 RepID=UPI001BA67FDE|nr:acyl-CoA dehydrogenase family protein [Kutzneria sp. CA-103260]QUQ65274.1 acyl-CoA dehydrogenase [Kutzneria sp. CA-103260]